jgi:DnaJ-domain-containing protein 1
MAAGAEPTSFSTVFRGSDQKQSVCLLAVLTWVAACDGKIGPTEQEMLDKVAEAVDDKDDLATIEATMRTPSAPDLELACRYLKNHLDRGGKKLLAQLAVTVATQDGYLTVSENLVLQFLADLLGLSPRQFSKLYQQIAHQPFPLPGDPSSAEWWRRRESGEPLKPSEVISADDEPGAAPAPDEPMTRAVALRVLGLEMDASRDSVHKAYRRLAKTRHPDRFAKLGPAAVATATEAFRRLHEAYQLLSV